MDSASSVSVITGRVIFLTMTALPESDAATSFDLNALFSKTRRIASATAEPSIIAPSTILSGGTGWVAKAATLNPLPDARNSIALTALEPMSRPTAAFDLFRPNTVMSPKTISRTAPPGHPRSMRPADSSPENWAKLTSPDLIGCKGTPLESGLCAPAQPLTVPGRARMIWVYRCLDLPDRLRPGRGIPRTSVSAG